MLDVGALIAFVAVIDTGSFSGAAQQLGQTPSGVSRTISRLEQQLGMTLIHRTTRRLDLTEEGSWLLARARRILADLEETESQAALARTQPAGLVRVNAATPTLDHLIAPQLADFFDAYPQVQVELTSGETVVDLIEEKADVAIRIGNLADSTLNARRLGRSRIRVLAAPGYLERHGTPRQVEDLSAHRCITSRASSGRMCEWEFRVRGRVQKLLPSSSWTFNDDELVLQAVLDGHGIAQLPGYLVSDHLRAGRLVACLTPYAPDDRGHYLCYLSRLQLPARVRVFIDYMITAVRALDLECATGLTPMPDTMARAPREAVGADRG